MKFVEILDKIERVIISVLFAILVAAIFSQVVNRNIFKLNISWFEEVARGCIVYILMFGTEIGLRDHSQLSVDSITSRLPKKIADMLVFVSNIATIVFSGIVGITSIEILTMQYQVQAVSASLGIPTYISQASVTIGCLLICFTQIVILINTMLRKRGKEAIE